MCESDFRVHIAACAAAVLALPLWAGLYDERRVIDARIEDSDETFQCDIRAPFVITAWGVWSSSKNASRFAWSYLFNPNRKIFEARKRETAALGAGEKLVLGHPLAATIGDSARCMQNLEKVLFTGPKTSDTVTFICD